MEQKTSKEFVESRGAALEAVRSGRVFEAEVELETHKEIAGGIETTERVMVVFRGPQTPHSADSVRLDD